MKNIFITGGTGYIGSHLCRRLLKDGHKLHVLKKQDEEIDYLEGIDEGYELYIYDGTLNSVREVFLDNEIDIVFHLAAYITGDHTSEDIDNFIQGEVTNCQLLKFK